MNPFKTSEIIQVANSLTIYNLGCEMLYLIHHRLKKIIKEEAKINRTITDIAASLFSDKIENLIQSSSTIIKLDGVQNVLYKLCHCSIIMLDPVNFARLFQMIAIAFKRQLVLIKNNAGIFHVTINHLEGVDLIVTDPELTKKVRTNLEYLLNRLSKVGYQIIKTKLMNILIKKNHKIGLYLNDGTQSNDGNILAKPASVAAWNVGKIGAISINGKSAGVMGGMKPYIMMKNSTAQNLLSEEETMGENIFEKIGDRSSHIDYVVLDKNYVKNLSKDLSNVIIGGKRKTTGESIEIDFDEFCKDESTYINSTNDNTGNKGTDIMTNADDGLLRFGAKKQETKKIDDIFKDVDIGDKGGDQDKKKEIKGSDLLDMFDDL